METSEQSTNVGVMFPDDAETFMSQHPESTFTVLEAREATLKIPLRTLYGEGIRKEK